ncbi:MAG: bifunctional DNA primase/polymerase [Hyphomicrobiaceae bacterium]
MREHIKRYTSSGWHLLPLRSNGKVPDLKDWVNLCSSSEDVVAGWLRRNPTMNLGVACGTKSGFFVIDVDKKHGGMETFAKAQASTERFPATLTQRTAGGGLHLLYAVDEDFCPGNLKLDKHGLKGIETRGQGGQIVIAPSVVDGNAYVWDNDLKVAAPPRWLLDRLTRKPTISERAMAMRPRPTHQFEGGAHRRLEGAARKLAGMGKDSGRNNMLNQLTYLMASLTKEGKLNADHIRQRMYEAARESGLGHDESTKTIESAFRASARNINIPNC